MSRYGGPGVQIPGEEFAPQAPIKRKRMWALLCLGALVAFELWMTIDYVATSKHPSDFIGEWILGSLILISALAVALGIRGSDMWSIVSRRATPPAGVRMWNVRRPR